MKPNN
jgi:ATP-dependent RNA helicase DDX10/DBP4